MSAESFNKNKNASQETGRISKIFRNVVAGAALIGAVGASEARASEPASPEQGTTSMSMEHAGTLLSPEAEKFLAQDLGFVDSGVMNWKEAGQVPHAWQGLDDRHLQALVRYINRMERNASVKTMLHAQGIGFVPIDLAELIQTGVQEIVANAGYNAQDPASIGDDLKWGQVAQATIYKIYE